MGRVIDIYARVSRLGDDRQRSTEGQASDCETRLLELGHQVGATFVDPGKSAWNPRVKRNEWHKLMARLESGESDGVIVFDLARFSRRPIEGERLIEMAERGLLVLDSEGEYDLISASGRKAFRDQLSAGAYESDRLSTRTRRGKRLAAVKGDSAKTSWRAFGFEPDGVTWREGEADALRDAVSRVLAGENQDHIVKDWNGRGITTSTGREWTRESFKQLLLRPRNHGEIIYKGTTVSRLPGEPLIDDETWERLIALFASRKRGRPISDTYLLSGLIFCGLCGNALQGHPRKHLKPYDDGEYKRRYWCFRRKGSAREGCGKIAIDWRAANGLARELVAHRLADPRHAARIEAAAQKVAEQRHKIELEIERTESLAEQLAERLGRGEIDLRRFDAAVGPLDARLAKLRAELATLGQPAPATTADEHAASVADWYRRWDAATVAEQRLLFQRAFRGYRVLVDPADPASAPNFDPRRVRIELAH
jgi:site-specific DNA recombinase